MICELCFHHCDLSEGQTGFCQARACRDGAIVPLNIEFKKPDNKKDNPLRQMGGYIDEIVAGRKKRANGLAFGDCSSTCFRCYAICDLTTKMVSLCKDAGLRRIPDGMGYYGYQSERNAYFEVISDAKLLADAKKRDQILFDKLFTPKPGEVGRGTAKEAT